LIHFYCICFLLFLLKLNTAQADFYGQIKDLSPNQQKTMLENRIKFSTKRGVPLQPNENLNAYISVSSDKNKAFRFFMDNIQQTQNVKVRKLRIEALTQLCPIDICFDLKEKIGAPQNNEEALIYDSYIYNSIKSTNLDWIIANKARIEEVLLAYVEKTPENIEKQTLLSTAVAFHFENVAKKLVDHKSSDKWTVYYSCILISSQNKLKLARSCFSSYPDDPWFFLELIFLDYIEGKKISEKDLAKIDEIILQQSSDSDLGWAMAYRLMHSTQLTERIKSKLLKSKVLEDYTAGFFIFKILDPKSEMLRISFENYQKKYPNKMLTKILQKKDSGEAIRQNFPDNSFIVQVLNKK